MSLEVRAIDFKAACAFIAEFHSHHDPPQGWKFGTAVYKDEALVGVIMVGRPVARMLDNGTCLEVIRCCTDGTSNVASLLYSRARKAAFALGYSRLITYTLASESGHSLKAAGWICVGPAGGGSWTRSSRPRAKKNKTDETESLKHLWEAAP